MGNSGGSGIAVRSCTSSIRGDSLHSAITSSPPPGKSPAKKISGWPNSTVRVPAVGGIQGVVVLLVEEAGGGEEAGAGECLWVSVVGEPRRVWGWEEAVGAWGEAEGAGEGAASGSFHGEASPGCSRGVDPGPQRRKRAGGAHCVLTWARVAGAAGRLLAWGWKGAGTGGGHGRVKASGGHPMTVWIAAGSGCWCTARQGK